MNLKQLAEHRARFERMRTQDLLALLYGEEGNNYSAEELQTVYRILIERGLHLPEVPLTEEQAPEEALDFQGAEGAPYPAQRWGYASHPHQRGPRYRHYRDVPGYRRSDVNLLCIVIHIVTGSIVPLGLVSCLTLLTGEIYSKKKDEFGYLKVWGMPNKIGVIGLLALSFSAGIALVLKALNRPFWD